MKFITTALAAIFISTQLFASDIATTWGLDAMNKQVDETNFLINSGCSGTLIDSAHGLILTANHCIAAQYKEVEQENVSDDGVVTKKTVRISVPGEATKLIFNGYEEVGKMSYTFKVVKSDKVKDLALVQLQMPLPVGTMEAPVACEQGVRGDTVIAVGNPMGVLYSTVSYGNISSLERSYSTIGREGAGLVQTTAPIGGGNSGGALYNDRGEIVGVNVMGYRQISPLGFAVPLVDIREFLGDKIPACVVNTKE